MRGNQAAYEGYSISRFFDGDLSVPLILGSSRGTTNHGCSCPSFDLRRFPCVVARALLFAPSFFVFGFLSVE